MHSSSSRPYPGGAAYSDLTLMKAKGGGKALAFFFEKDNYNTVAFGKLDLPLR